MDWPGKSFLIKVTDVSDSNITKIDTLLHQESIRAASVLDKEFGAPDPEDRFVKRHRRLHKFDTSLLTTQEQDSITNDHYLTVTYSRFTELFKNKSTGTVLTAGLAHARSN